MSFNGLMIPIGIRIVATLGPQVRDSRSLGCKGP